ncbi:MAG: malto-oligosyltrehalose trehalohydrolase [Myxococcota bacterium]
MAHPGRRHPVGAESSSQGVHFRVWAPACRRVDVILEGRPEPFPLEREPGGYFSALVRPARAGTRYRFRLDEGEAFPDPASRYQPEGPHGPSEVVDPTTFRWTDESWRGVKLPGQVLYELHVGTFTPEGTFDGVRAQLPELRRLGITLVELMPVADFAGRFGWGYDGVDFYAPTRLYGTPDDLRRLVDTAHALGLGVILDVVYNHFGPAGNYLGRFSRDYASRRHKTEWGEPINFDGENCAPVREFFVENAAYWIDEFHLDGLRLDATQCVFDSSSEHVLTAMARRAREAAGKRSIVLMAESETQRTELVRPVGSGGCGLDAVWNDDFHHSAVAALTGRNPAYYTETRGTPQELISAVRWGYLYQGQWYAWQNKRRGTPALDLPARTFVTFLENHDQVANSARGQRLHQLTSPGRHRALTALFLLAPGTPLLFMGQEFNASSPFVYFADHEGDLGRAVREGRMDFLTQFPGIQDAAGRALVADPGDSATVARCKLDFRERETHAPAYRLHQDLLRLRREDPNFSAQDRDRLHGAVLGEEAFLLRWLHPEGDDRLLLVNLGRDLPLRPAAEPLLAPPRECPWTTLWSSEDPRYGGDGTPPLDESTWVVQGHAAVVLRPARAEAAHG